MIEQLFEVIPHYPGMYIAIIEDENYNEVESLNEFCKSIDATLHVKSLSNKQYSPSLRVDQFEFSQNRYDNHAVQYDFVYICAKEVDDLSKVANKTYRILKNAGHLFFLCKKEFTSDTSEIFENSNYVAINTINLNSEYDIISAKKMHGWMNV